VRKACRKAERQEKRSEDMKTRFILIRHGESEANLGAWFAGYTNADLSPKGERQARLTAAYIKENYQVDAVYASDLARAFKTAKATAELFGLEPIPEVGLREINAGRWEGLSFDEIAKRFPSDYSVWMKNIGHSRCTDGESVAELSERIYATILRIAEENPGKTIAIGTHATPIRTLQCRFEGISLDGMKDVPWVPNASVTVAEYEDGRFRLLFAGEDRHLGDLSTVFNGKV
jgi:broad specificity phosphatase PhoE